MSIDDFLGAVKVFSAYLAAASVIGFVGYQSIKTEQSPVAVIRQGSPQVKKVQLEQLPATYKEMYTLDIDGKEPKELVYIEKGGANGDDHHTIFQKVEGGYRVLLQRRCRRISTLKDKDNGMHDLLVTYFDPIQGGVRKAKYEYNGSKYD